MAPALLALTAMSASSIIRWLAPSFTVFLFVGQLEGLDCELFGPLAHLAGSRPVAARSRRRSGRLLFHRAFTGLWFGACHLGHILFHFGVYSITEQARGPNDFS